MNKRLFVTGLFVVGVIGAGAIAYGNYGSGTTERNPKTATRTGAGAIFEVPISAPQFSPKVSDEGGVTVTITPLLVSSDASAWEFDVVLSTHVQELSGYDLAKLATLVNESGSASKPISWAPDATEGHHIGGVLKFDRPETESNRVVVKVLGIGGSSERVFEWNI